MDTYGGGARHGGGAFSGKDPSKVDRSAAYVARYVAKNVVAAGIARQCQVQVAYAIGVAKPMNITVYTEGTGVIPDEQISKLVAEHFDLRPRGIVQMLDLLRADLREGRLRPLRPRRTRVHVEKIDRAAALGRRGRRETPRGLKGCVVHACVEASFGASRVNVVTRRTRPEQKSDRRPHVADAVGVKRRAA